MLEMELEHSNDHTAMTKKKQAKAGTVTVIKAYLFIPKSVHKSHVMHVHLSDGQKFRQVIWRDSTGALCHLGVEHAPAPKTAYVLTYQVPDEVMDGFRSLVLQVYQSLGVHPLRFYVAVSAKHRLPNFSQPSNRKESITR